MARARAHDGGGGRRAGGLGGRVVGEGTPEQIRATELPVVHQFVHGETDGPVPFHYPAPAYAVDVGLAPAPAEAAHA